MYFTAYHTLIAETINLLFKKQKQILPASCEQLEMSHHHYPLRFPSKDLILIKNPTNKIFICFVKRHFYVHYEVYELIFSTLKKLLQTFIYTDYGNEV